MKRREELPGELSLEQQSHLAQLLAREGMAGAQFSKPISRQPRGAKVPLSYAQQRLWFLQRLEPQSPAYNLHWAVRLRGRLDLSALKQALSLLLARHDALRTSFPEQDGLPRQLIHSTAPASLPIIDLGDLDIEDRERAARDWVSEERETAFDLPSGPPLRWRLLRLTDDEHILLLVLHHIISDGWSMNILIQELTQLYTSLTHQQPPSLAELPIQYADYAIWQRECLSEAIIDEQLSYWREQLEGLPPVLELPTDRPRHSVQTTCGAACTLSLSREVSEGLKELGKREEATLFMVLLGAWQVLLSCYSDQNDIAVGTPIAGRGRSEVEGLIGLFVNTLVLRTKVDGAQNFRQVLEQVKTASLAAYAHQELPFEMLVEELQPERSLSRNALFQLMFVLHNEALNSFEWPGLTLTPVPIETVTAKCDLTLYVAEASGGLSATLEYSADLFDADTAMRMLEHFRVLLESIVAAPERRVSELSLLTADEQQQLLSEWSGRTTVEREGACVHELFELQVSRTPDAIALVFGDKQLSYAELNRRANLLAHELRRRGVGPDIPVALVMERSMNMIVAVLGILKAGGAYVPLDMALPRERLAFMLRDTRAPVIVAQRRLLHSLPEHDAIEVCVDDDGSWPHSEEEEVNPTNLVSVANLAYIIYTSGSTGTPKGVMIQHGSVANLQAALAERIYAQHGSPLRVSLNAPLIFDGSVKQLVQLLAGHALHILPEEVRRDGALMLGHINEQRLHALDITPSHLRVLAAEGLGRESAATVYPEFMLVGGEAIDEQIRELLSDAGIRLYNVYGPTECTVDVTTCEVGMSHPAATIGRPLLNVKTYILNEAMKPVPAGVPGELYVGGAGLARGYLNRPDLTVERFVPDPFSKEPGARLYRTGDKARYLWDGQIEYLGRLDHQVKVRSHRIELGEIESVMARHEAVRQAVVVVREVGIEKRLVAYVVGEASASELRRHLKERVPEYMIPSAFVSLSKMPLTPNGKVDRRALPKPDGLIQDQENVFVAPRTPLEELIAGIWCQVLGMQKVSRNDNFFEMGGHSLLAMQILSRVRNTFHVEVSMRHLFEHATVAGLAASIEAGIREAESRPQAPPIVPIAREATLPLSFAQQRLWFLDQLEPGTATYNIPHAVRITGQLDVTALTQTLTEMVRRHEVLRTTFPSHDGQPVQLIHEPKPVRLPVFNLSPLPEQRRESEAAHLIKVEARQPFDLAAGPLLRAALLRLAPEDHIVLLTFHHIISDGWSTDIFFQEVAALYDAFAHHRLSPLPEPPLQYADFAQWQRHYLTGEVLDRQLTYWRHQLAGAPDLLALPIDRPRTAIASHQGTTYSFHLEAELAGQLRALSRREGVTLFMMLLAAFKVLLWRYTGEKDVVVGTPIANRNRAEIEGIIGFFVNTLVLRTQLTPQESFIEVLRQVREVALGANAHQDVPFEMVVEALQPVRELSHNPLFQVMFVMQNAPHAALEMSGLRLRAIGGESVTAKFDLSLLMEDTGEGMRGAVDYSTELFESETIERLVRHLEVVLKGIVADPKRHISELPLLTEGERQQMLVEWNETRKEYGSAEYGSARCLHKLFEQQVERTPNAVAVLFEDEQASYRELNERANQLAHHLRQLGVGPDVLVGILMERSIEMVIALLGVLKAGGAYVPLDPQYPQERLSFMLSDAHVTVLLTQATLAEDLPSHSATVLCLDRDRDAIAEESAANPASNITSDNLAYVIYTSGSTGQPKGVMIAHHGICNRLQWGQQVHPLTESDSVLQATSFSFDVSVLEIFAPLVAGARLVLSRPGGSQDASYLVKVMAEHKITYVNFVPSLLQVLLDEPGIAECKYLKQVVVGGESLQSEIQDRFFARLEAELYNLYGPTESSIDTTLWRCKPGGNQGIVPIGHPLANMQTYILDANAQPAPVGIPGELHVAGVGLARGYLNRPDQTAEKFIPNPFSDEPGARMYKTGDVARYLPDGNIEFISRMDDQVKVRGFRIELGEIESVLNTHANVKEAVVVAREDKLLAYIVPEPQAVPEVSMLRGFLKHKLPHYMMPSAFLMIDSLPLTPNGKVDRKALPLPQWGAEQSDDYTPPRTAIEEVMADIWMEVLGVERVGVTDNFFELGGHSLLATRIIARMRERLQVEISLRSLFSSPTIAALASELDDATATTRHQALPPLCKREAVEPIPLSYAQQRLWFLQQLEPQSVAYNIHWAVRLRGHLHLSALEQALSLLIERHETLRTSFPSEDGQPRQLIHPPAPASLPLVDLSDLQVEQRERAAIELVSEERETAFDLWTCPPVRWHLLRLADDEHILLLVLHHIISDGWSMNILIQELTQLYTSLTRQQPPSLAHLPIQYADYAIWQRECLSEAVIDEQLSYWREQLEGLPPVLELPLDHARPAMASASGGVVHWTIGAEVMAGLRELSRSMGSTLYMVMLGAFNVLLARYTGQGDVVVGTPVAGRMRREVEGVIGFFVNTLALRAQVVGEESFKKLVERVREAVLSGQANQDVPFERVVEELGVERSLSHSPVFQVFFNMLNIPTAESEFPGLEIETIPSPEMVPKFDLTLYVKERKRGIDLTLVYNADLFKRTRMIEMLGQLNHLLAQVAHRPEEKIARLSLITTDAERLLPNPVQAIQARVNRAVQENFSVQARMVPDKLATLDTDAAWTYKELNERSNQLANCLLACGIRRQDVVAIYGHRSAPLVWAMIGVLKAGAAFLILDPAYPDLRLIEYLDAARPRGWLEIEAAGAPSSELGEFIQSLSCCCRLKLRSRGVTEASSSSKSDIERVSQPQLFISSSIEDPQIEVDPNDLAYVAFTSGSTGKPKGILGSHDSLTHFPPWLEQTFGLNRSDRFSMLSGLSHDPLLRDIFTPLQLGATLCIPDPENISAFGWLAQWMNNVGISVANLTPALAQLLITATPKDEDCQLTSLRYAFFVGDALSRRDVSAFKELAPSVTCINLYGATETQRALGYFIIPDEETGDEEHGLPKKPLEKEIVPVGRGIEDVQLLILNEARQLAGMGEVGEVYFRSPHLAKGYLGGESLSQECFITNPLTNIGQDRLYKTGDLGRYLPDGNVELFGRADYQIKIRGFRVEPAEIEAALKQQQTISNCTVMARVDKAGEKALVAYVVMKQGSGLEVKRVREQLLERLPQYMVPTYFVELDELPLTPNGKVDRKALPLPQWEAEQSDDYTPPRTATEEVVAGIWMEVLRVERVGVTDNFFELGGHSLLATRIMACMREALQVNVPLRLIFESPTVAKLAEYVEAEIRAGHGLPVPPIKRVERGGDLPLAFDQEAWLLRDWWENPNSEQIRPFHGNTAYRLTGRLNITALEQALNEVVRRHEILRTSFIAKMSSKTDKRPKYLGRPVQQVASSLTVILPVTDLSHLGEGERETESLRIVTDEFYKPFSYSSSSLLRVFLVRLSEREHVLGIVIHHLICDGWSLGVLLKEFFTLYESYSAGQHSPLPELPIQFADFAHSQREWLRGDVLQTMASYWKERLTNIQLFPEINLPFARPEPASPDYQRMVESQSVTLPATSYQALEDLSRQHRVTLFMLLLAALNTLLYRYTGKEHVGVFSPIANRSWPETHALIGWFATGHVLTSDFSANPRFSELLGQVREVVLDAYAHQDIPASLLMRLLLPHFENTKLVQRNFEVPFVFFDLRIQKQSSLCLPGVDVMPLQIPSSSADAGLSVIILEQAEEMKISIKYSADRFETAGVTQMLADFQNLLADIVANPEERVSVLP
jgi:amino acid adenylation domain-containing protein